MVTATPSKHGGGPKAVKSTLLLLGIIVAMVLQSQRLREIGVEDQVEMLTMHETPPAAPRREKEVQAKILERQSTDGIGNHREGGELPEHPLQALPIDIQFQDCPAEVDSLKYVRLRLKKRWRGQSTWQQDGTLNDKWGFFYWAMKNGFNVPEIHFCSANGTADLAKWEPTPDNSKNGFVVKVKEGRKSSGVYLLESGFGGREVLSNEGNFSRRQVMDGMNKALKVKNHGSRKKPDFHVEEYLPGPNGLPPTDYKVFVADQSIAVVAIVANRGTKNSCVAMVNENFERMDKYGCFSNDNSLRVRDRVPANEKCDVKVYENGKPFDGQMKCSEFAKPVDWDAVMQTAKDFSKLIGIYVRLDLYVLNGKVYLGEATFLPTMGSHHCVSQLDQQGCIDPCYSGRFWKAKNDQYNNTEGGPVPREPDYMRKWRKMDSAARCEAILNV